MMHGRGKSDSCVVPMKSPNKAGTTAAEATEGRRLAKGNLLESNAFRTPCRGDAPSALERVRQAARKGRKQRFTALLHQVYDMQRLLDAYHALGREAAAGVDGETWQHYAENLEGNLRDLAERLKRGAYRAKPVRRAYIPKGDGRQRPLGVPTVNVNCTVAQRSVGLGRDSTSIPSA
jgi:RNA-directed DNA polymerase